MPVTDPSIFPLIPRPIGQFSHPMIVSSLGKYIAQPVKDETDSSQINMHIYETSKLQSSQKNLQWYCVI